VLRQERYALPTFDSLEVPGSQVNRPCTQLAKAVQAGILKVRKDGRCHKNVGGGGLEGERRGGMPSLTFALPI
jgi:hypothetical protein